MLTFSCYQRRPLLMSDESRAIVGDAIVRGTQRHRFVLLAWILMPEHVHLVVVPWDAASGVDRLLFAIKRPASYRIKRVLRERNDPLLGELTVRERPGKLSFRFWQEGPGHDRNIRSEDRIGRAIKYVHDNPVRRGLCGRSVDWDWSSARQYAEGFVPRPEAPQVVRWGWGRGLDWDGPDAWFAEAEDE